MSFEIYFDWNITTYEATATGDHQGEKKYIGSRALYFYWIIYKNKIKFYMRGAESSK